VQNADHAQSNHSLIMSRTSNCALLHHHCRHRTLRSMWHFCQPPLRKQRPLHGWVMSSSGCCATHRTVHSLPTKIAEMHIMLQLACLLLLFAAQPISGVKHLIHMGKTECFMKDVPNEHFDVRVLPCPASNQPLTAALTPVGRCTRYLEVPVLREQS
jgi:hypothetical protein